MATGRYKRGAALLLSAVMLLGMLPAALAADEDLPVTIPEIIEDTEEAAPPSDETGEGPAEDAGAETPVDGAETGGEDPEGTPVSLMDLGTEVLGISLDECYTDEVFAYEDEYDDAMGYLRKVLNAYDIFSFGAFTNARQIAAVVAAGGDVEVGANIAAWTEAGSGKVSTSYIGGTLVSSINPNFTNPGGGTLRLYLNPETNVPTSMEEGAFRYTTEEGRKTLVLGEGVSFGLSADYVDFDRSAAALEEASAALTRASRGGMVTPGMVEAAAKGQDVTFPQGVRYGNRAANPGLDIQVGAAVTLADGVLAALKKQGAALNLVPSGDQTLDTAATWITLLGKKVQLDQVSYDGRQYVSNNWCDPTGLGTSMGLVWNLPQATSLSFASATDYFGHVLAPSAKVTTQGAGSLDGDIICDSFKGRGASCHSWGYLPAVEPAVPEDRDFTLRVEVYAQGADLSAFEGSAFQITVAGPNGYDAVLTPEDATVGAGMSWTLEGLTPGEYTLTQTGYALEDKEFEGASVTWNGVDTQAETQLTLTVDGPREGEDPAHVVVFTNGYSEPEPPTPIMVTVVHHYGEETLTDPAVIYTDGFAPAAKNIYDGAPYTLLRQEGPRSAENGDLCFDLYYEKYEVEKHIIVVHDYGVDGAVNEMPVPLAPDFQPVPQTTFQGERYTLTGQSAPTFNGNGDMVIVLHYVKYVETKNVVVVHDYAEAGTLYEDPAPYVEGFQPTPKTVFNGADFTLTTQEGPTVNGNGDMVFVLRYAPVHQGGNDNNGGNQNGGGNSGGSGDREDPAPAPIVPEESEKAEEPDAEIADGETPLAPLPEDPAGGELPAVEPDAPVEPAVPAESETEADRAPAVGQPDGTSEGERGVVILDSTPPTGNLPQTGTAAPAADPTVTLGLLALACTLALAGLGLPVLFRRKEED